ncbi:efflux RND transporter periplasmic adaptor subunit [Marivita sp. S2033]|uniref:efflux RND transporter periplasmic adaptor subunit n=1 Tax=Marivita sp. S2033 TaxID=3373187 RepID=UPI003981DBA4
MFRIIGVLFLLAVPGLSQAQDMRLAKIIEVQPVNGDVTRQFFGNAVAKETVDLAFQVAGQIVELPVIEGERIAKGTVVAQLDLEPFELALEQARVQKEQAERNLERLEKLSGSTVSQVSVDDAVTAAKLAEIAVQTAERSLRNATLHAPFDALVASRNVANFSTIAAGTPVVRLHDMSDLRIEIDVPEILFQSAGRNAGTELWAQFPTSDERFAVRPREYKAETSNIGQTFRITLGMTPPEDHDVLPGSSITVFAKVDRGASELQIPASAVVTGNDGSTYVMLFEPVGASDGTVTRHAIKIAPGLSGQVRVIEGLEPGQEIVASGATQLADGDRVQRFSGFAN